MNYTPLKSFPMIPLIFVSVIIILLLAGGSFFFFLLPKVQIVKESKQTITYLPEIRTSLGRVGESLEKMYSLITGQTNEQSATKTLLRLNLNNFITQVKKLNKQNGEVAGAKTENRTLGAQISNFTNNINSLYLIMADSSEFGIKKRKVMGESTNLESQRTTLLRQIKNLAEQGTSSSQETDKKLNILVAFLANKKPPTKEIEIINQNLTDNNQKVAKYLVQANRTNAYYYKISDFQIKLNPFLTSYYGLISEVSQTNNPELFSDRINELKSTIDKLNTDIKNISLSELPQGLEELHQDNLKVVEILVNNINEVSKNLTEKSYANFLKTVLSLSQELEPLATRSISLELNFWQNNASIKNYEDLVKNYKTQENSLQDIINKNKVPLLTES